MGKRTVTALLARGFDSELAGRLADSGYTIATLKSQNRDALSLLGLPANLLDKIFLGSRPPIPAQTVNQLLYESARICCICRTRGKSVVIHHIVAWHISRCHDIENLVVLCLTCHDDAHSTRHLSLNLTAVQIKYSKQHWADQVRKDATQALLAPSSQSLREAGVWDYFNHSRLCNLASEAQVDLSRLENFATLRASGALKADGFPSWSVKARRTKTSYMYEGGLVVGTPALSYVFYSSLLKESMNNINWVDVTGNWSRSQIVSLVKPGTVCALTGAFRFKWHHKAGQLGPGQMRTGYRRARGICLRYEFDGWETVSTTAYHAHLTGIKVCTSIVLVRRISVEGNIMVIDCSALAIGAGFTEYQGSTPLIAWSKDSEQEEDEDGFAESDEYE
jgi:hypothetical protein